MISAILIRQVLDKFLKAETVKSARIQVRTSDGVYHDVKYISLLENKIFGARESHRVVIEVSPERAPMGESSERPWWHYTIMDSTVNV